MCRYQENINIANSKMRLWPQIKPNPKALGNWKNLVEHEKGEISWFTFWVPGTPLVCFQWFPPPPPITPHPQPSANTPSSHFPPFIPKFSGNPSNHLHHPFSSHSLASHSTFFPLNKHRPSSHRLHRYPRPASALVHLPILQSSPSLSKSACSLLLFPFFLSLWAHQDVKYSQLLLRSGSTATGLWANRGAANVWSQQCTFHLRSNTGPIDPDAVKTETAYWALPQTPQTKHLAYQA